MLVFVLTYSVSSVYALENNHHLEEEHHRHSESCNHVHTEYGLGIMSLTVSALSAETLEAEIIRSDTDNSVKIVWTVADCTGTLNGASYISGTWIRNEGSYLFALKDAEGNSKTYTFSITHYYETSTVAPTCSEKGYTRYTCKQCGGFYDADFVPMTGHIYISKAPYLQRVPKAAGYFILVPFAAITICRTLTIQAVIIMTAP
jgi:hypothetical protein